jgi:hypothetical protein
VDWTCDGFGFDLSNEDGQKEFAKFCELPQASRQPLKPIGKIFPLRPRQLIRSFDRIFDDAAATKEEEER